MTQIDEQRQFVLSKIARVSLSAQASGAHSMEGAVAEMGSYRNGGFLFLCSGGWRL